MTRPTIATLCCCAGTAHVQQCFQSFVPANPTTQFLNPVAMYDTARSRITVVDFIFSLGARVYTWNGTSWTLLNVNGPNRRTRSAAAYDQARDRIVVFGGYDPASPGSASAPDVWEWDGSAWTIITAPPEAERRFDHTMIYDPVRQQVALFGGVVSSAASNDLKYWTGSQWTVANPANRPPPRAQPRLTFDVPRGRLQLAGGSDGANTFADFWEWDGVDWSQRAAAPDTRSITFDPIRARTMQFRFLDTLQAWEYDPALNSWSQLAQLGPSPVSAVTPIFDPPRSRIVIVSGGGLSLWNSNGSVVAPWISSHPQGGAHFPGNTVVLGVGTGGTKPIQRWQRNGQPLVDGPNISGTQTPTLIIHSFSAAEVGSYTFSTTNSCGSVTSNAAPLSIYAPVCSGPCYANCDGSTGFPAIVPAEEFQCFINKYAGGCP